MQRQFWQFYWPLALTSVIMLIGRQFQNGVLARYPDAPREIAIFAFASSTFFLFNSALVFVPQMTNSLGRSRHARNICLQFILLAGIILCLPLIFLGFTFHGKQVVSFVFKIDGETLDTVTIYFRLLFFLIPINGLQYYFSGLLLQGKRTGLITILNCINLTTVITTLFLGIYLNWEPLYTIAGSQILSSILHCLMAGIFTFKYFEFPQKEEHKDLTVRKAFSFFWPVAFTSTVFALSRPVIYSYCSRLSDGVLVVASLRVAFDFVMIFHHPLNQMRNIFITFGTKHKKEMQTFFFKIMTISTLIMVATVGTPLRELFFQHLLGVKGEILERVFEATWVLCLVPVLVTFRNYFHGQALSSTKTISMAAGSFGRIFCIYLFSMVFFHEGMLDHVTGSGILVFGFLAEGLLVMLVLKKNMS